ncbi:thiol reductant ABC exporter subunit CydD [Gorillibacterium timonense]|uniref:thiol reductant ABC exporter subunit CydD n=1 Tax=Gorillibacterium timonense TaxID=1689269 RepID=UPI00071D1E09|nr:thiol reductant ABC exporter subunit CydD [Gorillibacterium timonense]
MGKDLMKYKGIKPVMALLALLTLAQTLAIILQAKWLAEGISALFAGESVQEQYGVSLLFLLAFGGRHVIGLLQQKIAYRFAEDTAAGLRRELMDKLFRLGPRFTSRRGSGGLVTLVLEGVAQFRAYLELFLPRMLQMGITPWLILAYVYYRDLRSGVILTLTMPILIIFLILVGLAAKKQTEGQLASYRLLSNHFVDSLRGLETLKVLGRSKSHAASIQRVSDEYRKATMKTLRVAFLSSFSLDFFTMLSVAIVAVNLGLRLIHIDMTLVTALTVLILAPEYFLPVRMVGADFHATQNGKQAAETMQEILDTPLPEESADTAGGAELPSELNEGDILTAERMQVKHEAEGDASLEGISFAIAGSLKVGIIGESGAGKTTLIDAIGGFLPLSGGKFRLNGEPVRLTSQSWKNLTTYIPQQPYLFYGSLADNVRFYVPEATDEEVAAAVQAAGLGELVKSLPNGLAEKIGSGGRALSGGQEQRVALARAYLSRRPVLLLDEPTAHLDIETEHELKETMLQLFAGKRVFLATHRLHWMPDMDLILVMDKGRLAESGTHEELLAQKGHYYNLIRVQEEGVR